MLSGAGSQRFGGRWNGPGRPVAYTSDSAALALLETLVRLRDSPTTPALKLISLEIPDGLIDRLQDPGSAWNAPYPTPRQTQTIGNDWFDEARSVALQVPSVIVPRESNYLLNPRHPDFSRLAIGPLEDFPLDSRLVPSAARG